MPSILQKTPVGWQRHKLGDYGFCVRGVSYAPGDLKSSLNADALPLLRSNNIQDDALDLNQVQIVTKRRVKDEQVLRSGDIFICMSNGSRELVGKNVFISNDVESTIGAFCALYRVNNKKDLIPEFVQQIFKSEQYYYQVGNALSGTSINNLKNSDIENLTFDFPPIDEQEKIAAILAAVDDEIQKTGKVIFAALKLKEGLMQDIFSFKNVEGVKWLPLRDIGKVSMCKRVFKDETSNIGEVPFYKIGTFGKEPDAFISQELFDNYRKKFSFPKTGDVLLSASGTIGRKVRYDGKPAYFQDSNIIWLDHDESKVLNDFLYYLYDVIEWQTEGSTIKRLYNDLLLKKVIPVPPISEQKKVIEILSSMEQKIQINKQIRSKLLFLKQGLMQDLLTGKVRTEKYEHAG